jgi:hypothetical protein
MKRTEPERWIPALNVSIKTTGELFRQLYIYSLFAYIILAI